jgi:hypothetical protein
VRWDVDQVSLQPLAGRPSYPYLDEELRKVERDAYVSWQSSRYSVPWRYAGQPVWVREAGQEVSIHSGSVRIAVHQKARGRHEVVTEAEHHRGIPLGPQRPHRKILVHLRERAPIVETRPLAAYESVLSGGSR